MTTEVEPGADKARASVAARRSKVREWVKRYAPMEIIGTISAMAGAIFVHWITDSRVAAALAGSICETVGYYSVAAVRDAREHSEAHGGDPSLRKKFVVGYRTVRGMLVEFGFAEVIDSAFVRPALMYVMPIVLGSFAAGVFAGKILADVVFYGFAIAGYELRKKLFPVQAGRSTEGIQAELEVESM